VFLIKINFTYLMQVILYFSYWYFIICWNQIRIFFKMACDDYECYPSEFIITFRIFISTNLLNTVTNIK